MNSHVFISYAREDRKTALRLREDLLRMGVTPWLDVSDLVGGQDWRVAIKKALRESSHVLLLVSNHTVSKRGYVQKEVKEALEILAEFPPGAVFVIPVRLEQVEPLHEELARLHWVDLFPNYESGLTKIARSLGVPAPISRKDGEVRPSARWPITARLPVPPAPVPTPTVINGLPKVIAIRTRLREPIQSCEHFRELVDRLEHDGEWSYTTASVPPIELTHGTDAFISTLRKFASELREAGDEIDSRERENVKRYGIVGAAGNLLGDVRAAMYSAAASTDRLVELRTAFRAGLSLTDLQQTPQYQTAAQSLAAIEEAIYAAEDKRDAAVQFGRLLEQYGKQQ
jgi:hypothetical protein